MYKRESYRCIRESRKNWFIALSGGERDGVEDCQG